MNASMYDWIVSTSIPHSTARLARRSGSWMRCAPEMISSPRMKISNELEYSGLAGSGMV